MNKFIALILGFIFVAGSASVFAKGKKDGDFDIEIIHIPPNKHQQSDSEPSEDEEQEPPFFLFVTANGLKGHLNHGDCIVPVDDDEAQNSFIQDAIAAAGFFEYEGIFCSTGDDGGDPPD